MSEERWNVVQQVRKGRVGWAKVFTNSCTLPRSWQCRSLPSYFQDIKNDQWEGYSHRWSCPYGKYQKAVQGWIHLIKQLWVLKNFVLKRSMLLAIIVKHLEQLATVASIRERERRLNRTIEEGKQYQDYNWSDLIESGKLSKLKVNQSWTGTSRNTNFHLLARNQTNWRGSPQISISEMTRRPPQKTSQLALRVILFGNLTRMTTMF